MNLIIPLPLLADADPYQVGEKAFELGVIFRHGIRVPRSLCITKDAYEMYVRSTGLMERISLELGRKDFRDMRWEELWDASLRIRGMFLNTAMPSALVKNIRDPIEGLFGNRPVDVRSSALGEDYTSASFAGLHESYLNIKGIYSILDHIRLVWASLWSDAALLHCKELELDVHHGTMAVIVQGHIAGRESGLIFAKDPAYGGQAVIEAFYSLDERFADGMGEQERWVIDRATGTVISHEGAVQGKACAPSVSGDPLGDLRPGLNKVPSLSGEEVREIYRLALKVEAIFGSPQDVEWTFDGTDLYTLQSLPISASSGKAFGDSRDSHLGMGRGFENIKQLKVRIEDELIPEMMKEAASLSHTDLTALSDDELAGEILERTATYQAWERAYGKYFLPFAHGMRLFGRVYNDTLRPHDPYEFMDLLRSADMLCIERNARLEHLAEQVRQSPALANALRDGRETSGFPLFDNELTCFMNTFGDLSCSGALCGREGDVVRGVILKLALKPMAVEQPRTLSMEDLEEYYLSFFPEERKCFARDLLHLARASCRLRDGDSIYLGRFKGHLATALDEGRRRLSGRLPKIRDADIPKVLKGAAFMPSQEPEFTDDIWENRFTLRARQLVGQPAGSGIANGPARVILHEKDLIDFNTGEIIVCDALEASMTFIIPLASGIVERSGALLIHGAVIAREYGLPCVTGVPEAMSLIKSGEQVTVDGYLGIVIIHDQ